MGRDSCKKRESERNQGSYSIMWLSSGTESQLPIAILVLHMSGFQYAVSKFHAKIQVRVSSCNFQVSSFTPRSRSGFQVAISKFQVSQQDPGQGFKLQFPSFKFQTKFQVRVSSCNFQVSSFKPRSESGVQVAISKFQVSSFENQKTYTFLKK